jgi:hypothetical protein
MDGPEGRYIRARWPMGSFSGHRIPYSLVHVPIWADSHPIAERRSASRRKIRDLGQITDPMSVLPSTLPIRIQSYTLHEYKIDITAIHCEIGLAVYAQ